MPGDARSSVRSSIRLPAGVLGIDYLKFLQLSVDDELLGEASLGDEALGEAMSAIRVGSMRAARPAMRVFFDGCRFWLASHFHRYEAARRLGARHQEFWCEIRPGPKDDAVRYASSVSGFMHFRHDASTSAG
ncbi:hypothetical protein [Burkholderia stagnalis]|uniref:Uncharacterized protein n=1 Tax=Burkholderia stagnalis TaxID=1503054 RepID=A0A6L3MVW2_9BURK|nr:hypothetical protein [Burkholderia stagnalis]KAB0637285.1 hypothetical protein F7R25_16110 [Burkholderia stagnalis]